MRVDLAAQVHVFQKVLIFIYVQVLSSTVSSALKCYGGDRASETSRFCAMFNNFFDCLNVSQLSENIRSQNPFKAPYRSPSDFRLQVCKNQHLVKTKNLLLCHHP